MGGETLAREENTTDASLEAKVRINVIHATSYKRESAR